MTQLQDQDKFFSPRVLLVFLCEGDIYENKRKHLEDISSYSRSNDVICLELKEKILFMGQSRILYTSKDTSEETKKSLEEIGFADYEEKTDIGDVDHFQRVASDVVQRMMLPVVVVPGQMDSLSVDYPIVKISKNKITVMTDSHHHMSRRECYLSDIEDKEHLDSNICREIIKREIERGNTDISERFAAYLLVSGKWTITNEEWPVYLSFTSTTLNAIYNERVEMNEVRTQLSEYLPEDLLPSETNRTDEVDEVPRAIIFYAMILNNHYMGAKQLVHMGYLRIKEILVGCSLIEHRERCIQTSRSEAEKLQKLSSGLTDDAIGILNKVKTMKKLYLTRERSKRNGVKEGKDVDTYSRESFDIERSGEDVKHIAAKLILNEGCLGVAIQTKNSAFIQHNTTNKTINKIWYGKEEPKEIMPLLVLMTLLHPVLLPLLMINSTIWPLDRLYEVYRLPAMKVFNNVIGFLGFLLIFADMLLFDHGNVFPYSHAFVIYWMVGFTIDEIFQVIASPRSNRNQETGLKRFKQYYSSLWNFLDIFAIVVFFVGLIQHEIHRDLEKNDVSAVIFVFTFGMMCIRTLYLFCISEFIGPNLVVIKGMMKDTIVFTMIMTIFLFMYTVSTYSLMFPNSPFEAETVGSIIQSGLWILFGEIDLDQTKLSEPDCTFNKTLYWTGSIPRCPESIGATITPFMTAIYCALAILMLINLLVAIYNNTFQRIKERSRFKWLELQENFLTEYTMKAIFPIHFQVLAIPFLILHLFFYAIKRTCCRFISKTKLCVKETESRFITVFVLNLDYKQADPLTLSAEVHAAQELRMSELKTIEDDEIMKLKSEMKQNSEANDKKTAGIISTVTNVRRDLDKIQRSVDLVRMDFGKEIQTMRKQTTDELNKVSTQFGKEIQKMHTDTSEELDNMSKEISEALEIVHTKVKEMSKSLSDQMDTGNDLSSINDAVKTMDEKVNHKLNELEKFFGKHTIFKKFAAAGQDKTE